MDIRQLVTFRMVAATLSFTQAANALGYVQSSVTAQIQALEADLGVPLFDRLGKRISLTDAGHRLLKYAEQILTLMDEARSVVGSNEEPSGTLAFSAPESLCAYRLPPVLRAFRERYPQVQLVFRPSPSSDMQRRVSEGLIDLAFMVDEPIQSVNLRVETLVHEALLILASPEHPLTARNEVRVADLAGEPMLLTEAGCTYRSLFERVLTEGGVYPPTTLEFGSVEAIKQCVMTGMGLTFLPAMTVSRELAEDRLMALRWAGPPFAMLTQMIYHKDKWVSPALAAFIELARQMVQSEGLEQPGRTRESPR
ncbi:MAG TPA: LysR family transcriptional regulator [Aggregatilineales bacterium]|nr:LysR family transcriptional regulator [Aggregatilineales bacterium]